MLTIIGDAESSNTIVIPAEEMKKLAITDGEEVEFAKNEDDEIVLRFSFAFQKKAKNFPNFGKNKGNHRTAKVYTE